jgi:hypothetical protein
LKYGEINGGELQTPADIDLLIVYLIEKMDGLSKTQLLEAISAAGTANYMQAAQCIFNLVNRGILRSEGLGDDAPLHITELGQATFVVLVNKLPRSVIEETLRAALRLQSLRRGLAANSAEILPAKDGCTLSLEIKEGEDIMLSLRLFVADERQARAMRNRFLTEPGELLETITAALL